MPTPPSSGPGQPHLNPNPKWPFWESVPPPGTAGPAGVVTLPPPMASGRRSLWLPQRRSNLSSPKVVGQPPLILAETGVADSSNPNQTYWTVTINASNTTHTTFQVFYGPTVAYGSSEAARVAINPTAATGTTFQGTSPYPVTNLTPGTYHYQFVATNSDGQTFGPDQILVVPPWWAPTAGRITQSKQVLTALRRGAIRPAVQPQQNPVYSFKVIWPAARRIAAVRRGIRAVPTPGQDRPTPLHWPAARRIAALRRGSQPQTVRPQVNPPFQFPVLRIVQRIAALRRGSQILPWPAQAAPAAPLYPFQSARSAKQIAAQRRGARTWPVAPQLNPPYPFRVLWPAGRRIAAQRRGTRPFPTPGQERPIYVTQGAYRRLTALRKSSLAKPTPGQQNPPYLFVPIRSVKRVAAVRGRQQTTKWIQTQAQAAVVKAKVWFAPIFGDDDFAVLGNNPAAPLGPPFPWSISRIRRNISLLPLRKSTQTQTVQPQQTPPFRFPILKPNRLVPSMLRRGGPQPSITRPQLNPPFPFGTFSRARQITKHIAALRRGSIPTPTITQSSGQQPILPIVASLGSNWTIRVNSDFSQMSSVDRTIWNVGWTTGPPYNNGAGGLGFTGTTNSQNTSMFFGPHNQTFNGTWMNMETITSGQASGPGSDTPPGTQTIEGSQLSTAGLWSLDVRGIGLSPGVTGTALQGMLVVEYKLKVPHITTGSQGAVTWMTNDDNYGNGHTAWTYKEEIDLMEMLGGTANGSGLQFHLHDNTTNGTGNSGVRNNNTASTDMSLAPHTWTWLFTNATPAFGVPAWSITCWVDGTVVTGINGLTGTNGTQSTTLTVQNQWIKPQYLIIGSWSSVNQNLPLGLAYYYLRIWTVTP